MTAAKIMDIISRLPWCDGQAADTVSAYTQVNMEDAHKLLKIPKSECPDIWIRLPRHKWPKSWSSMEACSYTVRKGFFSSVRVDNIKLAGKKQNPDPMWKLLKKEVDLGEPTSVLDHVYLGCTQRQCEISKNTVDSYRTMFESRISAGGTVNYHSLKILVFLHGFMKWKVLLRNVWSDLLSWQTRRLNDSAKCLLFASMTTTTKKKKWNLLENCHKYALKFF